ncbi:hypothetical protein COV61_05060 [Candidatus Micrarchaeota archaeon CG11_big_fil_rev_8_21_14_0_20_47_5]|nr:MAG: hypothetical protein AUJ17_05690 [Candidatus Micrarchaeota archaeon CG1_02_47_40]PIN82747.1 MAG: hypothetical protein COV61_05060 [Candidatus Micrarchaeota archaeon CG11_big_fil_rev_8_21_14_0_20_47_5]
MAAFLLLAILPAYAQDKGFVNVKEKSALVLEAAQTFHNAGLSYSQRLEHYKRITQEEKTSKENAPSQFYVFWSENDCEEVSYNTPTANEDGFIPISTISSYAGSNNYDYGTDFSHTTYVYDEQDERLYLRQTTQYYLRQACRLAKLNIEAAKEALSAEEIENGKLQTELDSLYSSIDREEADIAFASQAHEISFAADMLKNDLSKAKLAVKEAYLLCAQKNAGKLLSEAEKEEKAGEYSTRAEAVFESIKLYPTAQKLQSLLYNLKMSFRWLA